jgi:hypothetical protein
MWLAFRIRERSSILLVSGEEMDGSRAGSGLFRGQGERLLLALSSNSAARGVRLFRETRKPEVFGRTDGRNASTEHRCDFGVPAELVEAHIGWAPKCST